MFVVLFNKRVELSDTNCVWADPIESHIPYSEGTVAHGSLWSSVPEKIS